MNIYEKYKNAKQLHKNFKLGYFKIIYLYYFKNKCINLYLDTLEEKICLTLNTLKQLNDILMNGWKVINFKNPFIKLQLNDIVITCRINKGFDLGHLIEIYNNKIYGKNFINYNIIDVGMSNGDSTIYFAKYGAKKVVGLEPDKESYDLAQKNIKESNINNKVVLINKALSHEKKLTEFIIYDKYPNANSIDEKNMVKLNSSVHKDIVETITLYEIFTLFNGENIDLLKMDCEGCEYEVLNNLDSRIFNKIIRIYLEFHNGVQNLPNILKNNGYNVSIENPTGKMGYIRAEREGLK